MTMRTTTKTTTTTTTTTTAAASAASLRVLVVDDSALFVEVLSDALQADPRIKVVGSAGNGDEAVAKARALRPDLITMDVQMPGSGGLGAVEQIMSTAPVPILVLTDDPRSDAPAWAFESLRRGALDVRRKPVLVGRDGGAEAASLREHIKLLAETAVVRHSTWQRRSPTPALSAPGVGAVAGALTMGSPAALSAAALALPPPLSSRIVRAPTPLPAATSAGGAAALPARPTAAAAGGGAVAVPLVGIVASTGGPAALLELLSALPASFDACVLIVQHLAHGFGPSMARWLHEASRVPVELASLGAHVRAGHVWLAPDGHHLSVCPDGRLAFAHEPASEPHRPSGNVLLRSIARSGRAAAAAGVVLTGMGSDGSAGLLEMKRAGARTLVQSAETCVVDGMPSAAIAAGAAAADEAQAPRELAATLASWCATRRHDRAGGAHA